MKQRLLLLLFSLCLTFPAWSQFTPQGFSYQSIVRNSSGNALTNQTITLLFSIRSGAPNGPVAYTEKQVLSTNEFGLVNLTIGQGGTVLQGTFNGINWGGGAKYLTVAIESSPNVFDELGSTQLMSVPYALYAQTAANGGGGGGSDNWGSQSAQTNPTLSGNGTPANPLGIAQHNAEPGQVLKWNGTEWLPSNDLLFNGVNTGTVTQINTGTGLSGGPITTSGTVSLANTGVTPGPYGSATQIPVLTIDAQGRVTNAFTTVVQPGTIGLTGAAGINVQQNGLNFIVTNTGDTNAADDVNLTTPFGGDVTGTYNDLQIKSGVVGTLEIADGTVSAADLATNSVTGAKIANNAVNGPKIDNMGATNGQVLKWNGTTWAPANDNGGNTYSAGTGISVTGAAPTFTINNTGDTNANDDLTTSSTANGDVSGPFSNLQIKADAVGAAEIAANAVGTTEIVSGAVTTDKVANSAITGIKIDDMSAATGQVLKWNGTTWAPANDLTGVAGTFNVLAGPGIDVTQSGTSFTVFNTGDLNANDDITTATTAGGDVTGPFNDLQIKAAAVGSVELANNAVTTVSIINGAVTGAKINNMGAGTGQVLKYNGTAWAPANDDTGTTGTSVTTNATLTGSGTLASPLGIAAQSATNGQVLKFNGTTWLPANDAAGLSTVTTNATLAGAGTVASPLGIAAQGASNGQVLKFNGTTWAPAADDTGTTGTNVTTNATLSGSGTVASPLGLAAQGAANGQVLKFNGTTWIPATIPGDNWGTQAALTGNAISGDGTSGTPLNIAQQGALTGEVLKWTGTGWKPAPDESGTGGNTYAAGTGISITGAAPNFTINNTGDADKDPTNELQKISLAGNQLTLSINGGTVTLPPSNSYTAGTGINITGTSPNQTIVNTGDLSNTNELQNLSLAGSVLTISGTNSNVDFNPLLQANANSTNVWKKIDTHIFNLNPDNVLIGSNTNSSGKLQVFNEGAEEAGYFVSTNGNNNKAAVFVKHAGSGPAAYLSSAAGPALVTNQGNVGINTTTPAFRLDVNGDANIKTTGIKPQLTLESDGGSLSQLIFKQSGNSSWMATAREGSTESEFNIDLLKTPVPPPVPAPAPAHFINIKSAGLLTLGNTATGSSTKILHGATGLVLQNNANNHNWEFFVNDPVGSLELYNDQFSAFIPAGTFATNGLYVPSDARLKKDIADLPKGILGKVMQLRPVTYHYKSEDADKKRSVGFLAQDVQALFPELVGQTTARDAAHTQYLSVNYAGFSVFTIQAMQEQQTEIERLKNENDTLRQQMESLETRLQRLEKAEAPHKN